MPRRNQKTEPETPKTETEAPAPEADAQGATESATTESTSPSADALRLVLTEPRYVGPSADYPKGRWTRHDPPGGSLTIDATEGGGVTIARMIGEHERKGATLKRSGVKVPAVPAEWKGATMQTPEALRTEGGGASIVIPPAALSGAEAGAFVLALVQGAGMSASTSADREAGAKRKGAASAKALRAEHEPRIVGGLATFSADPIESATRAPNVTPLPALDGACPLVALVTRATEAGWTPSASAWKAIESAETWAGADGSGATEADRAALVAVRALVTVESAETETETETEGAEGAETETEAGASA